jgi:hypothetical protein
MPFAKTGQNEVSFKPLVLEFFGAANKKRVITQEGGSILV